MHSKSKISKNFTNKSNYEPIILAQYTGMPQWLEINKINHVCRERLKLTTYTVFQTVFFLSIFFTFSPLCFFHVLFLALQNKKYSNSDFITKNLCNIVFGFPFGSIALHCKWEKTSSHVNT